MINSTKAYACYCVTHEKFFWDARQEQGVRDRCICQIWGTDELLVSFDAMNLTFPNRKDAPRRPPWEHIDQSPIRCDAHCIQGIMVLSPSGPGDGGLFVFPGSHKLNDEFFDSRTDRKLWLPMQDVHVLKKEELEWFSERGVNPHKICAEVGDLILWDSRTIHSEANRQRKAIKSELCCMPLTCRLVLRRRNNWR